MAYISFQPTDVFNTVLYTGTGAELPITGVGFQPDWVWMKSRSGASNSALYDSVRGVEKGLASNLASGQNTSDTGLEVFGSDGFTLGTNGNSNTNTVTYASWNWKAGTTSGLSGGTITPTAYSFNTTSGVSIVQYDGNSTSGATVPHGLGATPEFVIIKCLDAAENWAVGHNSLGWTKYLRLDTAATATTTSVIFNDTAPTSTLVTLGNNSIVNTHTTNGYIMYAFADVKGYSQFGSYTGNGNANGTFVYTGFRPAYVLLKRTVGADAWQLADNKRLGYNFKNAPLVVSASVAEDDATSYIDILSNGFKLRTTGTHVNNNGELNIYMAFAEFPIVSSNDMPTVAR